MTMFSKSLGGHGPFAPPGYAHEVWRHIPVWDSKISAETRRMELNLILWI